MIGIIAVLAIVAIIVAVLRYPERVKRFFVKRSLEGTDYDPIVRYGDLREADDIQTDQTEDEA